ncbi:MAG: metal ABC transporter permease [Rhodothermales bacterium]
MLDLFTQGFILNALLVSIVMGLLLAYLGVHVVARGIVFVDLALGQISMLGVAVAGYFERDPTVISILFTMVGAFILSFIKVSDKRLKQEAIIGIVYAFTSALTVLLISKSAHGDADISEVLFGSLFTVTETSLLVMTGIFALIGLIQFLFRKSFFQLTDRFVHNQAQEVGVFDLWNFLFYLSIGLAIVLAVRAGGVIPVFSFIVVPPVAGILLVRNRGAVVVAALIISVLGSFFGLFFSVRFDFPAGSSIVAMLGFLFLVAAAVRGFRKNAPAGD